MKLRTIAVVIVVALLLGLLLGVITNQFEVPKLLP